MNQILDHSGPKKKKAPSNSDDINSKIKVFAIVILIFGVVLIATGVNSFMNNNKMKNETEEKVVVSKPKIEATAQDNSKVTIVVTHDKSIEKVVYWWDDSDKVSRKGIENEKTITISDIGIPTGTHKLSVEALDVNQQKEIKTFEFSCEAGIDTVDPIIDIVIEGTRIEIVAEDETELQYITYRIGDGQEETIYPDETNKKRISKVLDLQLTQTTDIYVTAVDTANNAPRKQQTIVVYKKPVIQFSATADASQIIAKITSDTPLTKVKIVLNGTEQVIDLSGQQIYEKSYSVEVTKTGRNDITVEAYTIVEGEEIYETNTGFINYGG